MHSQAGSRRFSVTEYRRSAEMLGGPSSGARGRKNHLPRRSVGANCRRMSLYPRLEPPRLLLHPRSCTIGAQRSPTPFCPFHPSALWSPHYLTTAATTAGRIGSHTPDAPGRRFDLRKSGNLEGGENDGNEGTYDWRTS